MQDQMFRLNIKQKNERMTMLFFAFSKPSGVFSLITVYGEVSEKSFFYNNPLINLRILVWLNRRHTNNAMLLNTESHVTDYK